MGRAGVSVDVNSREREERRKRVAWQRYISGLPPNCLNGMSVASTKKGESKRLPSLSTEYTGKFQYT